VKQFFVKIWSWHVENNHNCDSLHSIQFHYSYDNIIVDQGKYNNFKIKKWINFWKFLFIYFVNVEILLLSKELVGRRQIAKSRFQSSDYSRTSHLFWHKPGNLASQVQHTTQFLQTHETKHGIGAPTCEGLGPSCFHQPGWTSTLTLVP